MGLLFRLETCTGIPVEIRDASRYVVSEGGTPVGPGAALTLLPRPRHRAYVSLLLDVSGSTAARRADFVRAAEAFVTAALVLISNLLADVFYAIADPRIRV